MYTSSVYYRTSVPLSRFYKAGFRFLNKALSHHTVDKMPKRLKFTYLCAIIQSKSIKELVQMATVADILILIKSLSHIEQNQLKTLLLDNRTKESGLEP